MTYVVAALAAVVTLVQYILIYHGARQEIKEELIINIKKPSLIEVFYL